MTEHGLLLTLFTIPKPFREHTAVIQRNAIQSWLQLRPACDVVLLGGETGTHDVAGEFGVRHAPHVQRNGHGTPLVSSAFAMAQQMATSPLMCLVDADIILMADFLKAVQGIRRSRFLMVGRRWRFAVRDALDFGDAQWAPRLREGVLAHGERDRHGALDYFVFPRGMYPAMPAFAVGRAGWDNWMIYDARARGMPVIDASEVVMAVHQDHDYSHIAGGKSAAYTGIEAEQNVALAGGRAHMFSLHDATWVMRSRGLRPALGEPHLRRRWETLPLLRANGSLSVTLLRAALWLALTVRGQLPRLRPRRLLRGVARRLRMLRASPLPVRSRPGETNGASR